MQVSGMSSGWIKFEKDLREDLRVKRMARLLGERHPTFRNAGAFQDGVILITVVLGALSQLWMHADTFARDDDTLDITCAEIDQLAGIQDFSQIIPQDWLEILDPDRVKLPKFQEHNGSEAKRKAQTAKRVSKHRSTHQKRNGVTSVIKPETQVRYQTRPRPDQDQDQTRPQEAPSNGAICDSDFEAVKRAYPAFSGRQDWATAEHCCNHLVEREEATWAKLEEGAHRYATYVKAASTPPDRVTHPKNFFSLNALDKPWSQDWKLPATKAEQKRDANINASLTWLADQEAKDAIR